MWVISPLEGCVLRGGLHTLYDVIRVFGTWWHVNLELRKKLLWKTCAHKTSVRSCYVPLKCHSSDTKCYRAVTHSTDRLLGLQTLLQACKAKDMSTECLYWLLMLIQAHRMRGSAKDFSSLSCAAQDFVAHFCNMHLADNCSWHFSVCMFLSGTFEQVFNRLRVVPCTEIINWYFLKVYSKGLAMENLVLFIVALETFAGIPWLWSKLSPSLWEGD